MYFAILTVPLFSGKVNKALTVDRTRRQWVDLGIHTEDCMTRPETCGVAGGAISLWVNLGECPDWAGIISTRQSRKTASLIYCKAAGVRFQVIVQDGPLLATPYRPSGWTHFVLNYIVPNDGDGIRIFYDGVEVAGDTTKATNSFPSGDGRVVIGRHFVTKDGNYASVQVDELLFFNSSLSLADIQAIFNAV